MTADDALTYACILEKRGRGYLLIHDDWAAQATLEAALQQYETILGVVHPQVLTVVDLLASAELALGHMDVVTRLKERSTGIAMEMYGVMDLRTATQMFQFGSWLYLRGEPHAGSGWVATAYAIRCLLLGSTHPETVQCAQTLRLIQRALADPAPSNWYYLVPPDPSQSWS